MGPIQSPMARTPDMGGPLWVTLVKIKIKKVEIKDASHRLSFCCLNFKTYPFELSREILEGFLKTVPFSYYRDF